MRDAERRCDAIAAIRRAIRQGRGADGRPVRRARDLAPVRQRRAGGAARARASTRMRSIRRERDLFELEARRLRRACSSRCTAASARTARCRARSRRCSIPYTGSGVMASALAMDKWRTKLVWLASGIPTPRYRVVDATTDWMRVVAELGLPLIVKPAREGSTIGITKVTTVDHDELRARVRRRGEARRRWCWSRSSSTASELTASIVNGRALPLIRIEAPQGNYDYHNKYFSDETKYFCPCGLPEAKEREIRAQCARRVRHRRLQRLGPARPDPARRRHVLVPRGEHVARHDRPQPRADGGASRPAWRSPSSASRSCEARMWDDARQLNAIAADARR